LKKNIFDFNLDWATPTTVDTLFAVPKELEEISTKLVAAGKGMTCFLS